MQILVITEWKIWVFFSCFYRLYWTRNQTLSNPLHVNRHQTGPLGLASLIVSVERAHFTVLFSVTVTFRHQCIGRFSLQGVSRNYAPPCTELWLHNRWRGGGGGVSIDSLPLTSPPTPACFLVVIADVSRPRCTKRRSLVRSSRRWKNNNQTNPQTTEARTKE